MSTVRNWTVKLRASQASLRYAKTRLAAAERGLAWARKYGRPTVDERVQRVIKARRDVRHHQQKVDFARRVLARHRGAKRVSRRGAEFIASFEGGQSADGMFRPYWDAHGKVWTIGYGHTKGVTSKSKPLTTQQAVNLLRKDLDEHYAPPVVAVAKKAGMVFNQDEFDALVSFAFNLGPGVLQDSTKYTMARAIKAKDRKAIGEAFLLYDRAGGKRLAGLTRRREAERAMFLGG